MPLGGPQARPEGPAMTQSNDRRYFNANAAYSSIGDGAIGRRPPPGWKRLR
jgi:hypothetical protein